MTTTNDQLLVIFGASGDLTKRKLIPSLFELFVRGLLPERFVILGTARTEYTDDEYRGQQQENLRSLHAGKPAMQEQIGAFLRLVHYLNFDTNDTLQYRKLKEKMTTLLEQEKIPDHILYYLATPPVMYELIPEYLRKNHLNKSLEKNGWRRIVVEKPFGTDLKAAQHLNETLRKVFKEKEIYRIDHYLGKETVQNILVLRFANGIFEPLWNRNYIDYIEICALETLGVENRGKYYEKAGALRDMIQNHLMQLMAFVAMESPAAFDPESLRDEVAKVLHSLRPVVASEVIRAQYIPGLIEGKKAAAYRNEKEVAPDSETETYVSMRFFIDNWRWGGIPFYFHTGKRLMEKKSEIIIHFKSTPHRFFAGECSGTSCNKLILRIQPDESISLKFGLKMPGAGFQVKQMSMDFSYKSLSATYLADAYERLLLDVIQGDSTLYTRTDALEASWRFVDPILQEWKINGGNNLYYYTAGSSGPQERKSLYSSDFKSEEAGAEFCSLDTLH